MVEVDPATAKTLIDGGHAEKVETVALVAPENAARQTGKAPGKKKG
ncbi:hypothetical protein LLH00_06020 [bacterium]|nr:hypothetical protein [bacterium]